MTDVDPFVQAKEGSGQRKQTLVVASKNEKACSYVNLVLVDVM